jgi:CubicO group peptidase (beta-lactamase class C family)
MKHLLILALLILSAGRSSCQQFDHYFNHVDSLHQLNGNILLAENNKIIYKKSAGFADFTSRKTNDINTRYNLASISKIFTSTAILQLKEKGKLKLDDALIKYLPDFPYPNITIRHLLTHTSGLPDLELFEALIKTYPDTIVTNKNIIPELKKRNQPLYFTPGDKFEYCNNGFSLLALVVEKITKTPFPTYLQTHIFTPCKMYNTTVSAKDTNSVKFFTLPFMYDDRYIDIDSLTRYKYTHYNCGGGTGGSNVITTTEDLLAFDNAFFSAKLLKPATIEEALSPIILNNGKPYTDKHMDTMFGDGTGSYGLGWEIFEQPGFGKSVGHGGFKFGLATFYFRNLKSKQTIIAFDNTANTEFGRIITSSLYLLNNLAPIPLRTKQSLVRIYGQALVNQGIENAFTRFSQLKTDTVKYYLSEWEMNNLGGSLLFGPKRLLALEVFKINTLLFPESFNTYDSYADALQENGKTAEAIEMYQYSILLNPHNTEGMDKLKRLQGSK